MDDFMTPDLTEFNSDTLLDMKQAAAYCRLPYSYFRSQMKRGAGPRHVMPSPQQRFFEIRDLDTWMAGWRRT